MQSPYKAAVDIGATKMTVSLVNQQGIIGKVYQKVNLVGDNRTIPQQVNFLIGYVCNEYGVSKDEIDAVGISTCSPFIKVGKYLVIVSPNLCDGLAKDKPRKLNNWTEIPLEDELSKTYSNIKTGNDCVTAADAERTFGAAKGVDNFIYVTWSTGIGTGAYVTGIDANTGDIRTIRLGGKNQNAPHGGHIYIAEGGPKDGAPCGCGQSDDLESRVRGDAIAEQYQNGVGLIDIYTTSQHGLISKKDALRIVGRNVLRSFGLSKKKGNLEAKDVFDAYSSDVEAKLVINRAARTFARGLATYNNMLDLDLIVIGGSVFMNNQGILMPLIQEEFDRSFRALSKGVEIKPSALDKYLGDIAALSLVMPEGWVPEWEKNEPWKNAPDPIVLSENVR